VVVKPVPRDSFSYVIFFFPLVKSTDEKSVAVEVCHLDVSFCHSAGEPQRETMLCADAVTLMTALERPERRTVDIQLNEIQVDQPFYYLYIYIYICMYIYYVFMCG